MLMEGFNSDVGVGVVILSVVEIDEAMDVVVDASVEAGVLALDRAVER